MASNEIAAEIGSGLATIGYLSAADAANATKLERAVKRFQRHAARKYRMPPPDASGGELFTGQPTGARDEATLREVKKWLDRKWKVPIGRFRVRALSVATNPVSLREDAATAWEQIVKLADAQGATLHGKYGDSARPVRPTAKVGTSPHSFHYCARAVDICQDFTKNPDRRYWVAQDPQGGTQYWRIYCKTDKPDGSQGTLIRKNTVKWYSFSESMERWLAEGYYVDLTALIESTGTFERIKSQAGWQSVYNKSEWWHFQYKLDKQATFLDEMELIGYSEAKLRSCGWTTDKLLDAAPG
jgi:hypothetical protein